MKEVGGATTNTARLNKKAPRTWAVGWLCRVTATVAHRRAARIYRHAAQFKLSKTFINFSKPSLFDLEGSKGVLLVLEGF